MKGSVKEHIARVSDLVRGEWEKFNLKCSLPVKHGSGALFE